MFTVINELKVPSGQANLRTIDFLASGGAVNKYANYAKIAGHNYFKTGPFICYVPLFRRVGG